MPDTTFNNAPHIVPHKLGGNEIGLDVCDECNHYFGTSSVGTPSLDVIFKEIFNAFIVFGRNLDSNTHNKLHSIYFDYYHNRHKIVIRNNFRPSVITRQFKRSLYEIFLQKYHLITSNGNNPIFEAVRKFTRYNIGNLHVYYTFNNMVFLPKEENLLKLSFSENTISDMMNFGAFRFWFAGHLFYLEVFPTIFNVNGRQFLQNETKSVLVGLNGNERIFEFQDIRQIDFLMIRFAK